MPKFRIIGEKQTLDFETNGLIIDNENVTADFVTFSAVFSLSDYSIVRNLPGEIVLRTSKSTPPIKVTSGGFIFEMASKSSSSLSIVKGGVS